MIVRFAKHVDLLGFLDRVLLTICFRRSTSYLEGGPPFVILGLQVN